MPAKLLERGGTLGRYTVECVLGKGGMSVVYKVRDPRTMMPYAAKVMNADLMRERDFVRRFRHEAKTARALKHMNIVHAFALKRWEDTCFYIMELVEGGPLDELLKARGAYELKRALVIVRDVAAALDYVHSKNYVHRDIKPANVLVRSDDHVKLIDFGLSQKWGTVKRTRSGHVMGSAKYMAPELIQGSHAHPETDMYALGAMAYELVTGKPPFDADNGAVLMDMHLYMKHRPLVDVMKGADPNLSRLIDKMLVKDSSQRLRSARLVHGWLDFYLANGWFADLPKGI